jgi:hypothetical protein
MTARVRRDNVAAMNRMLWRYEGRHIGWGALLAPPLALAAILLFARLANFLGRPDQVNRILSASVDVLPLVGAIFAASIATNDPALELQLTMPISYRSTLARRLILALGWTSLVALISTLALDASGRFVFAISPLPNQLIWLTPLLWLTGFGALLGVAFQSSAVGGGIVAVLWVFESAFGAFFASNAWAQPIWFLDRFQVEPAEWWFAQGALLLASAALFFALTFWLLRDSERLLKGASSQ